MREIFFLFFTYFATQTFAIQDFSIKSSGIPSTPLITTFTPTEYNAGIQNWDIDQDTTGYIYLANNYGLLEFDGASWQNYPVDNATKTRSVLVDKRNNRIYLGGQRQLGYFEKTPEGLEYTSLIDQIPSNIGFDEVTGLTLFDDAIYGILDGKLLEISSNSVTINEEVNGIEFIDELDETFLIGSSNGVFFKAEGSSNFKKISEAKRVYKGGIKSGDHFLLFTYNGEILRYNGKTTRRISTPIDSFLSEAKINAVLKLANGNIVIATQNNGLIICNPDFHPSLHLTKNKGINHRTVLSLYEDQFSNLWAGLNNGICLIELGSPFALVDEKLGLNGTGYSAVSTNEEIYFGTSSGLFRRKKEGSFIDEKRYELVPGSEGLVNKIDVIDGRLILSHHEGAFEKKNQKLEHFFNETGSWSFKKTSDTSWMGGTYEGFFLFENGKSIKTIKGFDEFQESSRLFEFDDDGVLWMSHGYKGVYKIELDGSAIRKVKRYGRNSGFPSDILISVYKVGQELIFTAEKGVYTYDENNDQFIPHAFLNKYFQDRHVSKLLEGSHNSIYFIANGEMGVLEKKAIGTYELLEKPFRKINSYISDDLENLNLINDTTVLVGAKEGFVLFNPQKKVEFKESFPPLLKSLTITNKKDEEYSIFAPFVSGQSIDRSKRLKFEFSSPYFDGVEALQYSYRLLPYESEWSSWTETNWKEYTNLSAADYTFEIKALNVYENESTVSRYEITVKPEWYETSLAYTAYASFVLFVFTTVILARERKHKHEKRFLSKDREEIIRTKDQEISEFSAKTNQEIQSLKNDSLKREIEHKNSELASVTMHLLSKNEFVASLRKRLVEAVDNKDNKEDLNKIVKSIDRNIDEDEAWKTFEHHFDQVHGNFLHKIKEEVRLTPQETKLCAYLKMNMSTKDIASLMNITIRGVELARYRLRKKLGLKRETNLSDYLDNY